MTQLVPAGRALAVKPDLAPAATIQSIRPTRVISVEMPDRRTIWYFERDIQRDKKRTCAYIAHVYGAQTFTLAYHPLDRNDQVVSDLPMERLGQAIEDLLAAGFGQRQTARPGREQGERLQLK